jgi:hypothetical protein
MISSGDAFWQKERPNPTIPGKGWFINRTNKKPVLLTAKTGPNEHGYIPGSSLECNPSAHDNASKEQRSPSAKSIRDEWREGQSGKIAEKVSRVEKTCKVFAKLVSGHGKNKTPTQRFSFRVVEIFLPIRGDLQTWRLTRSFQKE